jgi:hypothetical protein
LINALFIGHIQGKSQEVLLGAPVKLELVRVSRCCDCDIAFFEDNLYELGAKASLGSCRLVTYEMQEILRMYQ